MRYRIRAHIDDLGSLAVGALLGVAAPPLLVLLVVAGPTTLAGGFGLALFIAVAWAARGLARIQRRRLVRDPDSAFRALFQDTEVYAEEEERSGRVIEAVPGWKPMPHYRALSERGSSGKSGIRLALARLGVIVADPQTWRDFGWLLGQFVVGVGSFVLIVGLWLGAIECIAAPVLLVLLPKPTSFDPVVLELTGRSGPWVWILVPVGVGLAFQTARVGRWLVEWQAQLGAWLLGPRARDVMQARLSWLSSTRTHVVDASAAELRRIERDLHDGAQARLISVQMSLGVAEDVFDENPTGAKAMLAEARASAGAALVELRSLVRGIHPPVLADRGLSGAIQALVLTSKLPVDLSIQLDRRLKPPVEAAAYFAVAESMVNAIRHSGAHRIKISIVDLGDVLAMSVADDGRGGADPDLGTGLLGIRRRLAAFDGSLRLVSPPGGPTVLDMELPCTA